MKDPMPPQKDAPEGRRPEPDRLSNVRRRLFEAMAADNAWGGSDNEAGAAGGGGGEQGRRHRSRRRRRVGEQLGAGPRGTALRLLAEEAQRARHRWNFDFVSEQPLEGQWQWEKVGDVWLSDPSARPVESSSDSDSDEPEESDEESHAPQR